MTDDKKHNFATNLISTGAIAGAFFIALYINDHSRSVMNAYASAPVSAYEHAAGDAINANTAVTRDRASVLLICPMARTLARR